LNLGDQIIAFATGKRVFNKELQQLYNYKYEFDVTTKPTIQPINYKFRESPLKGEYLTYQFDKSFEQKTWCKEHLFDNRQLQAIYKLYESKGYKMVDIGNNKYTLKQTADIINGSKGHIGLCSGMGWFSLACGKKPVIWYSTNTNCKYLVSFKQWWLHNKATVKYFDENFNFIDCNIALDGKKYSYTGR
jgi:hypothetical protein